MAVTLLAPTGNFGSQIDRAICAFLIINCCGDSTNVSPSTSIAVNKYQLIQVKAFQSQHDPMLTGRESYQVQIQCKASAITESGNPNPEFRRAQLDALRGQALACLMQSDDDNTLDYTAAAITKAGRALNTGITLPDGQNNADMSDFTIDHLYWRGSTRGEPDDEAAAWVEILNFEVHGCAANVD